MLKACATGRLFAAGAMLLLGLQSGVAQQVTLDFAGLQDTEIVRSYYDAGQGSLGSGPGPDYGVVFSPDPNSRISTTVAAGQSVLFVPNPNAGNPAPITMDVAAGFSGPLSFQYVAPNSNTGTVTIYDQTGGTGNILATRTLPIQVGTPLYNASTTTPIVMPFAGTAKSVIFNLRPGAACIDNISFTNRQAPGLLDLTSNAGGILPEFDTNETAYTLGPVVAEGVESINFTARRAGDSMLQVSVNDEPPVTIPENQSSFAVALEGCTNLIKIRVETPGADTRTYTIDVAREGCAEKVPGPMGPAGPQGPAGPSNVVAGSTVHVFPKNGSLKIQDPAVTANSVILLQYIGGGRNRGELFAKGIVAGGFTAKGAPGRRFRYVIVN